MNSSLRMLSLALAANFAFYQNAAAEDQYEYPELAVTPRASKRLEDEQKNERSGAWTNYLPFQVSALSTLAAGMMTSNDPGKPAGGKKNFAPGEEPESKDAGTVATLVGGGWLVTTLALSAVYRPYTKGAAAIASLPNKSKREMLARERSAEEFIQAPASLMSKLKWLSVITNAAASGYAVSTVKEDNAKVMGALAAALSFSPLLFVNQYETIGCYQQEYKKRIYGPVASIDYTRNQATKGFDPLFNVSWFF